jgi:hypothetical protein
MEEREFHCRNIRGNILRLAQTIVESRQAVESLRQTMADVDASREIARQGLEAMLIERDHIARMYEERPAQL